jgi:hypothetical protein
MFSEYLSKNKKGMGFPSPYLFENVSSISVRLFSVTPSYCVSCCSSGNEFHS